MDLTELLKYFSESETIGENQEAVDMMRYYSREAQKLTMKSILHFMNRMR